ncbi:MAG TPA: hypothetical protein VKU38_20030 [Ktedonobacteraceae bacterium]|nr:hypothetical protein [Ktedonobacteraceae bacterium]
MPTTPVPPRASAPRVRAVQVRPRYSYNRTQISEESDPAEVPTQPPPATWQYDSQEYTAESSLSSLSLIVDTPTNPCGIPAPPVIPVAPDTPPHGMPRIEEMDTRPPAIIKSTIEGIVDSTISDVPGSGSMHTTQLPIEQQITMPMQLSPARTEKAPEINSTSRADGEPLPGAASLFLGTTGSANDAPSRALAPILHAAQTVQTASPVSPASPLMPPYEGQLASVEPASWTAGAAAGSRYAQLVAARTSRKKSATSFNLIDRLRWWLLHPGRFEFLMWLGGTILLMTITCIFLLMMVFSFQWNAANVNNGASSSPGNMNNPTNGQSSSPGLSLTLTNATALIAGQPLHLRGQGFSANGHVALSYDASQPFLNQGGQPVLAQTDAHGTFVMTLNSPSWGVGQHRIMARDIATGHLAIAHVTVVAITKTATATAAVTTPRATATTIQQGTNSPPVAQTPPIVPTTGVTPTVMPKPPTATPTVGTTPTVGITPTVTATPRLGQTPTVGVSVTPKLSETATVGNTNPAVLNTQYIANSGGSTFPVGPWLWLLIGGYMLAMLLFGIAGLVHKRAR